MRTMTFAAGLTVGYVLGTKAGHEKYEQLAATARRLGDQPLVSQTQTALKDLAHTTGEAAATKIASLAPDTSGTSGHSSSRDGVASSSPLAR
jgi:hypothetical protein